jgi:hypothetical protein
VNFDALVKGCRAGISLMALFAFAETRLHAIDDIADAIADQRGPFEEADS